MVRSSRISSRSLGMRTRQQTKLEAAALSENTWTSAITIPVQQEDKVSLASSLDPGLKRDLYFTCDPEKMVERLLAPQGRSASSGVGRIGGSAMSTEEVMRSSVITPDFEQKESAPPISQSKHTRKKLVKVARESSTGSKWFDMRPPPMTPQLKNDLRLLQMRNALDPSHHYKANDSKKLPRYFQVGRVVAGSADFYSGRIPRRQQKQMLVDELLDSDHFQTYHRKKYLELQSKFMSGTQRRKNIPMKKKFKRK